MDRLAITVSPQSANPPCAGDEILELLHARKRGSGAFALYRTIVILDVAPGTTCGNHRAHSPRQPGASQGMVFAGQAHEADAVSCTSSELISPYKREAGGSNPPAPTKFLQLGGIFETLIGDPVATAGNHRCMLPDGEGYPRAMAASPSTTKARRADDRHHRH